MGSVFIMYGRPTEETTALSLSSCHRCSTSFGVPVQSVDFRRLTNSEVDPRKLDRKLTYLEVDMCGALADCRVREALGGGACHLPVLARAERLRLGGTGRQALRVFTAIRRVW